jgi:16S rRNA (cytidine1402-2'-O)-methyltransferase
MTKKLSTSMVTILSTPIGNMKDISLRAVESLWQADIILCEDTRVCKKLLQNIPSVFFPSRADEIGGDVDHDHDYKSVPGPKPLQKIVAFHKFNEQKQWQSIENWIEQGKSIVLISDAGTPLINDPGYYLLKKLQESEIAYSAVPGPCSVINALVLSGFNTENFYFAGFLPSKAKARYEQLQSLWRRPETVIFFDTPHHIIKTLQDMVAIESQISLLCAGQHDNGGFTHTRRVAIMREMTKMHEEVMIDSASELLEFCQNHDHLKGEFVVVLDHMSDQMHDMMVRKNDHFFEQEVWPILQNIDRSQLSDRDLRALIQKIHPHMPRNRVYDLVLRLK